MGDQGVGSPRHPGNIVSTFCAWGESAVNFAYFKIVRSGMAKRFSLERSS